MSDPNVIEQTEARPVVACSDLLDIPRRPWLLSKQYDMTFVLSQDNEIILGGNACRKLGDDLCKYIIESVNARMSNAELSHAGPDGVNCKPKRDPGVALQ